MMQRTNVPQEIARQRSMTPVSEFERAREAADLVKQFTLMLRDMRPSDWLELNSVF
jgi:hypothetical protein